ncbi:hypothetical protein FOA52_003001 [Chlamydomonas sp. UWO 241]|nr:hypothetical protein FOA52_003001 [Chlamydomonas sp. UWO 241]
MVTRRSIALLALLLAVAQAAVIPPSPPSPPPSPPGSTPLANRNIVLNNVDTWGYGALHEVVGTTKGFSIWIDLPASDYINANGTLTRSDIELRSNSRELLAVAFWVAHTPDNTPKAPIFVRGVHSVASPASNATAHFKNGDAVLVEFNASAAPNFTYSGASIAEAANPLLWWTLKCKASAVFITLCLSTSLFLALHKRWLVQDQATVTFALDSVGCEAILISLTTHAGTNTLCSGVNDVWTSNAAWIASATATVRDPATWTKVVDSYNVIGNRVGAFDTISGIAILLPADVRTGISCKDVTPTQLALIQAYAMQPVEGEASEISLGQTL